MTKPRSGILSLSATQHRTVVAFLGAVGIAACIATDTSRGAPAGMDSEPEARALLAAFKSLASKTVLDDRFDGSATKGAVVGDVSFGTGAKDGDPAIMFAETRAAENYVQYSLPVPRRGRLSLDFVVDALPKDYRLMTVGSLGTAGNTCFEVQFLMDRTIRAALMTRRGIILLYSDVLALGRWHNMEVQGDCAILGNLV